MLVNYPKPVGTAYIAGYFTAGKWFFTCTSALLIAVGVWFSALQKQRKVEADKKRRIG